jgi:signal transduction histidine kinase
MSVSIGKTQDTNILKSMHKYLDLNLLIFSLIKINDQQILRIKDKRFMPEEMKKQCLIDDSLQHIMSESSYNHLLSAVQQKKLCNIALETTIGTIPFQLLRLQEDADTYMLVQVKKFEFKTEGSSLEIKKLLHDIKQPLSNISGFAECLEENIRTKNICDGSELEFANIVNTNARRLSKFIDSFLDNEGPTDTDLNILLNELLEDFKFDLNSKHLGVAFDNLPRLRMTYPDIRRLFSNLISNAIKYSQDNYDCIEIKAQDFDYDFCTISIRDHGAGISSDQANNLFHPFTRFHSGCKGIGLGLNICREIVEKYKGGIHAEPCKDGGTVFKLRLPFNNVS